MSLMLGNTNMSITLSFCNICILFIMDFGDAPQTDSAYEMFDRRKELNMIIMTDCGE